MRNLERIKKAVRDEFGAYLGDSIDTVIDKSVWEGDPYEWASGAVSTISLEHGLPGMEFSEAWFRVSDALGDMFVEFVNGGVAAVYKL